MHFLLITLAILFGLFCSGFVLQSIMALFSPPERREEWSDPHPDSDEEMYAWMLAQQAKRLKGKCKVRNEK
jgi:hypothetical protein